MANKGKIVVISGPSGVGKSTISREVIKRAGAMRIITMTTRPKAATETDGVDYHFATKDEFAKAINKGELLEYAEVFGHMYGSPKAAVLDAVNSGRSVVVILDVQGGMQVKKDHPEALLIFILPPDAGQLRHRLSTRGRDTSSAMEARLNGSAQEIAIARQHYDKLVINDDLERAIEEIAEIIRS